MTATACDGDGRNLIDIDDIADCRVWQWDRTNLLLLLLLTLLRCFFASTRSIVVFVVITVVVEALIGISHCLVSQPSSNDGGGLGWAGGIIKQKLKAKQRVKSRD